MRNIKKRVLGSMLLLALIISTNVIPAHAEWEKDKFGMWWYSEGNSWATGWRQIDGKWYYFNTSGYMEHDTTIDGYYLDSTGAWSTQTLDQNGRYKEGTIITLSGTLKKEYWDHPTSGKLAFYVLELDKPANFNVMTAGESFIYDGVKEIQITADFKNNFSNSDMLDAKVNQRVSLKGEIWGGAGTQYYRKNVTMRWIEDK